MNPIQQTIKESAFMSWWRQLNAEVARLAAPHKAQILFGEAREIRRGIIQAGQDTDVADFGRRHGAAQATSPPAAATKNRS